MRCDKCGLENCGCVDSREWKLKDTRRRRYKCFNCGYRWTTIELKVKDKYLKGIIEDDGYIEAAITKTMEISEELKRILEAMKSQKGGEPERKEDGREVGGYRT